MEPRPVEWVPTRSDSLLFVLLAANGKPIPVEAEVPAEAPFEVTSWRMVPPEERASVEDAFRRVVWTYLGANELTELDTTATPVLRAHLQARFGAPTFTLVEQVTVWGMEPDSVRADLVQFEYWLMLNDEIPILITDVEGPFDRGVILATDYRYAARITDVRERFLEPLLTTDQVAAYADYYFEPNTGEWYRTSFNGWRHTTQRIAPPNLNEGRPYARAGR